jgi:peptidoglycan hydrolase CwlO-like protein
MMDNERLNSVVQMAEAHLLNVQNELQKLQNSKLEIEKKIADYTDYLTQSASDVRIVKSELEPLNTPMPEMPE